MSKGNPNPVRNNNAFPVGNRLGGRPKGTRDRITSSFLTHLADDFQEHGPAAIRTCRIDDPTGYLRIVASLLPKEVELIRPLGSLSDDELADAVELVRAMAGGSAGAVPGSAPDGAAPEGRKKPSRRVPALPQAT